MADQVWKLPPPDDTVPAIPEAPSQSDSFAGRPACQEQWTKLWWKVIYEQQPDEGYRRLYYSLQKLVDQAIGRILEALDSSGMADDTIVVFTSDHGDMLGAHGGMQQKWCNAYDESVRVPMIVKGPGVATKEGGIDTPDQPRGPDPDPHGAGGYRRRTCPRRCRRTSRRSTAAPRP